mgnify:CR=1 FL=1
MISLTFQTGLESDIKDEFGPRTNRTGSKEGQRRPL